MATQQQTASYEPVIVRDSVFHVERKLELDGEVMVRVGDRVDPSTQIAAGMVSASRPLMLNIARELDVEPDAVSRYLTRPIGSTFEEGEAIARARRGLRSVTCAAPVRSVLSTLDESSGVATMAPEGAQRTLQSVVHGEVASIIERRGVSLRASGSRVRGAMALGRETYGVMKSAVDRADRELTADMLIPEFRDCIVLGGMTLGTSAMRRLIEIGARGVVVGSISDGEVRRFLATSEGEPSSILVWSRGPQEFEPSGAGGNGLTVFVTEGFGRRRMAQPVFQFLAEQEDQLVSLVVPQADDVLRAQPVLYATSQTIAGDESIQRVAIQDGTLARLIDPEHLGVVVTCRSEVLEHPFRPGVSRDVVDVEFNNGARALVPAQSVEVLLR